MKLNKKLVAIMIASLAAVSFVGCSSSKNEVVDKEVITEVETTEDQEEVSEEGQADETPSSDLYNKMIEGVELPGLMAKDEAMVADTYGIDMNMISDFTVMGPMMSVHITEIAVFNVADEANVETVKAAVEGRLAYLKNEGAFYPEQVEIAEKGQVLTKGNFVVLIVDGAVDQLVENFNTAQ